MRGRLAEADSTLKSVVARQAPGWRGANVTLAEMAERRGDHADATRRATAHDRRVRARVRAAGRSSDQRRGGPSLPAPRARQRRRRCAARSPRSTRRTRPTTTNLDARLRAGELLPRQVQRAGREGVVRRQCSSARRTNARALLGPEPRGELLRRRRRRHPCSARASRRTPRSCRRSCCSRACISRRRSTTRPRSRCAPRSPSTRRPMPAWSLLGADRVAARRLGAVRGGARRGATAQSAARRTSTWSWRRSAVRHRRYADGVRAGARRRSRSTPCRCARSGCSAPTSCAAAHIESGPRAARARVRDRSVQPVAQEHARPARPAQDVQDDRDAAASGSSRRPKSRSCSRRISSRCSTRRTTRCRRATATGRRGRCASSCIAQHADFSVRTDGTRRPRRARRELRQPAGDGRAVGADARRVQLGLDGVARARARVHARRVGAPRAALALRRAVGARGAARARGLGRGCDGGVHRRLRGGPSAVRRASSTTASCARGSPAR